MATYNVIMSSLPDGLYDILYIWKSDSHSIFYQRYFLSMCDYRTKFSDWPTNCRHYRKGNL